MEFEWDAARSDACFARPGFDFAYATQVFLDPDRSVEADDRFDYGEARYRVIGRISGRLFLVVYTPRAGRLRIISIHKANHKEVARHGQGTGQAGT